MQQAFYFDMRTHPEVRSMWIYKSLFNLRMLISTFRYDTGEVENRLKRIANNSYKQSVFIKYCKRLFWTTVALIYTLFTLITNKLTLYTK